MTTVWKSLITAAALALPMLATPAAAVSVISAEVEVPHDKTQFWMAFRCHKANATNSEAAELYNTCTAKVQELEKDIQSYNLGGSFALNMDERWHHTLCYSHTLAGPCKANYDYIGYTWELSVTTDLADTTKVEALVALYNLNNIIDLAYGSLKHEEFVVQQRFLASDEARDVATQRLLGELRNKLDAEVKERTENHKRSYQGPFEVNLALGDIDERLCFFGEPVKTGLTTDKIFCQIYYRLKFTYPEPVPSAN